MDSFFNVRDIKIESGTYTLKLELKNETFVLVHQGSCSLESPYLKVEQIENSLIYLPAGQLESMIIQSPFVELCVLEFSRKFYPHFFFEISNYFLINNIIDFNGLNCFDNLIHLCRMIDFELRREPLNLIIVKSLLDSFFSIYYSELRRQSNLHFPDKCNYHIDKLLDLIEQNYRNNHPLDFYSNNLVLTERQLNNLTRLYFKKSITSLLTSRKIIQAQRELILGTKSVSEIGYGLGFNEKSYFSKVFKKGTGMSPSVYQSIYTIVV